jgi:hypothetical protein
MAAIKMLSRRGEAIKGALVAHIAPLLATDKKLKAGEVDAIILACDAAPYKKQRPIIAKAFTEAFKPRLAKDDLDPDTVKELLLALAQGSQPSDEDGEGDEPEDGDDSAVETQAGGGIQPGDNPDGGTQGGGTPQMQTPAVPEVDHGKAISDIIAKSGMSPEDQEACNGHIQALGAPKHANDKFPPKTGKEGNMGAETAAKPDFLTKPAMDAALLKVSADTRKETIAEMAARWEAVKAVKPIIGDVNPMAFDTADAIYLAALDHAGVKLPKNTHPSAYATLVSMHLSGAAEKAKQEGRRPAMDATVAKTLAERYKNAPKLG